MKKIICLVLSLLTLLTLFGCRKEDEEGDYKNYVEGKMSFSLPKDMSRYDVPYADLFYKNEDNASFLVKALSNEELEDPDIVGNGNISVEEYALLFKGRNDYTAPSEYDAERDCVHFAESTIWYNEDLGANEYNFEYYLMFRRKGGIYVVCMTCPPEIRDKYEPMFEYIDSTLVVND